MQRVETSVAVSVTDLKKSPAAIMAGAQGAAGAVLDRNRVLAYLIPPATYDAILEKLDDQFLVEIAKSRAGEKGVPVAIDDL